MTTISPGSLTVANGKTGESKIHKGRFYYDVVIIQVENHLHRVPAHHLRTWSQVFKDMFTLPQGPEEEGASEDRPIKLPGCTNQEFEGLLEILLTPGHLVPLNLSKEQWIGALHLSTMWEMPEVRSLCIKQISALEPSAIEKVKLGTLHKVPTWLIEGCTSLIEDADGLALETLAPLGWEVAAKIAWISRQAALAVPTSRKLAGIGSIPPNVWRCACCSATGNFQSAYCFSCRTHSQSLSVDLSEISVDMPSPTSRIKISEMVKVTFRDELSQMD